MPNWNEWEEARKQSVGLLLKLLHDGIIIVIAAGLSCHAGVAVYRHFQPAAAPVLADPVVPESTEPPVFRGSVRTVAGLPVRRASIYLQPGDGRSLVSIETNEAGFFESACPLPGSYRLHVQVGGVKTPPQRFEVSTCGDRLYEIRVRQTSAANTDMVARR